MNFMTWTLSRPSTNVFDGYYKLKEGEPWYSKQYEPINPDYFKGHSDHKARGFVEMLEKYPQKFSAIGMHEFGISDNGDVFNMGYGEVKYPSGYYYTDPNMRVLNGAEDDIERPVPTSLRYFMHKYPEIRWAIQFLATANLSGDRVTSLLNNEKKPLFTAIYSTDDSPVTFEHKTDINGNIIYVNAQDEFVRQAKRIAELYLEKGFPIADIEIDMEKTWTVEGEDKLFADLLARIKQDVCIPLGLGLRVNLFAMTGDYTPDYYGWHNYATVAQANVDGVQAVDEFQLMTYDFSWGGSAPGASTPLWWLQNVLNNVKDLEDRGLWKSKDVYIGNAGYGRRWALGEDRMGVTFDFKQMVQMQNGQYIHNDGTTVYPDPENPSYSEFPFRNQDFVPFAGYNDDESDYQISYPHAYDRFELSPDGGADFSGVNRSDGADYVTNYSLTQKPIFNGLIDWINGPTSVSGRFLYAGNAELSGILSDDAVIPFEQYGVLPTYIHPDTGLPTGLAEDEEGKVTYELEGRGTFNIVLQVLFPFYDKKETTVYVNGVAHTVSTGDWYPVSLMQRPHFYNLGQFTYDGTVKVEFRNTNGVIVGGVVTCESFDNNLTGGTVTFPVSTYPFVRRGEKLADGTVSKIEAQFPDTMRLVGEILRRTPRPAIVWEDMFSSYVNSSGEGFNVLSVDYYPNEADGGYSSGEWNAYMLDDYGHALVDSRFNSSQLVLKNIFTSSMMLEVDARVDSRDNGVYGLRVLAQEGQGANNGYLLLLDHSAGEIRLVWEDPATGIATTELTVPMTGSLKDSQGARLTLRAYVLDGKLSFRVGDYVYINEHIPAHSLVGGAYGFYTSGLRSKLYKYNLSSLERYERMERLEVTVDGTVVNTYGGVERTVGTDEYGFLIYKGYPADVAGAVNAMDGTVLDIEQSTESWSADYQNKAIAEVAGWSVGGHTVEIRMIDAGIWFRRFYIGDAQGMSISYNSDKVGFIRTANMITDYGCKGVAMWTLGQEDPTIYTYLPNSW